MDPGDEGRFVVVVVPPSIREVPDGLCPLMQAVADNPEDVPLKELPPPPLFVRVRMAFIHLLFIPPPPPPDPPLLPFPPPEDEGPLLPVKLIRLPRCCCPNEGPFEPGSRASALDPYKSLCESKQS